jgi:Rod binding domain-containing protein
VKAGDLTLEQLAGNSHVSDADKAHEVARQFEAILLRQILKAANPTGIKGATEEGGASNDVYFDMMNYHLADTITRAGGLGLASALEAQLQRQFPKTGTQKDEPAT